MHVGRGAYPLKSWSRTQAPHPTIPARSWEGAPAAPLPSSTAPRGWKRVVVSPCGLKCVPRGMARETEAQVFDGVQASVLLITVLQVFLQLGNLRQTQGPRTPFWMLAMVWPLRLCVCVCAGLLVRLCTRRRTQCEFTPLHTCVSWAVHVSKRTPSTGLIHRQSPRTGRRLHGPGLAHVAPGLLVAMFSLCGHTARTETESFGISGLLAGTLCSCTRRHRERACSRGRLSASARLLQLLNYAAPTSEPRLDPSGEPPVCMAVET